MKILNLYAGIGGNRKLWGDEHEITAVESEQYIADVYKVLYPNDTMIVGDAHQYLLDHYKEYDFIWSSPPCPSHSRVRLSHVTKSTLPVYPDMKLWQEIYFLRHFFRGKWIVENVIPYYEPFLPPMEILDRHMFWGNFNIAGPKFEKVYKGRLINQTKETLAVAHGIELPIGTKNQRKLLRNAVLPEMGLHILNQVTTNREI